MEPLTLTAADGVRISATHLPGRDGLCVVLAHGFTCHQDMPELKRIARILHREAGVLGLDFRGHGRSGGLSTVGDLEVLDLEAAVRYARERYDRVAVVGFSMGAATALRHAALYGGVDAVVSVSSPARWYYRDTVHMRRVHWVVERRLGRVAVRIAKRTRIAPRGWDPVPAAPFEVVGRISPVPLLVVHGERDTFFPVSHGRALFDAAADPRELWVEPDFGHAEIAISADLVERIGAWVALRTPGSGPGRTP